MANDSFRDVPSRQNIRWQNTSGLPQFWREVCERWCPRRQPPIPAVDAAPSKPVLAPLNALTFELMPLAFLTSTPFWLPRLAQWQQRQRRANLPGFEVNASSSPLGSPMALLSAVASVAALAGYLTARDAPALTEASSPIDRRLKRHDSADKLGRALGRLFTQQNSLNSCSNNRVLCGIRVWASANSLG
jgi:hypothetical protein